MIRNRGKKYPAYGTEIERIHITSALLMTEKGSRLLSATSLSASSLEDMLFDWQQRAQAFLNEHGLSPLWQDHIGKTVETMPEQAYYAVRILAHLGRLVDALRQNNTMMAAWEMMHTMQAIQNSTLTFFEEDIYRGAEGLKSSSKGGKTRSGNNKNLHLKWQRLADELWVKHPEESTRSIAKKIAKETRDKAESIRKKIKKP